MAVSDREALQWIHDHTIQPVIEIGEKKFSTSNFQLVEDVPKVADPVKVHTLTGLISLIDPNDGIDKIDSDDWVIKVVDHSRVQVVNKMPDTWGRRRIVAEAVLPEYGIFKFGQPLGQEDFIIGLQQHFVGTTGIEDLMRIAGNVTSEAITTSVDDGITQQASFKAGVHVQSKNNIDVPRRWNLAPYRTFHEIQQPESVFVFRLKQTEPGKMPTFSLFEADGGRWKNTAMESIGQYFDEKTEFSVVW